MTRAGRGSRARLPGLAIRAVASQLVRPPWSSRTDEDSTDVFRVRVGPVRGSAPEPMRSRSPTGCAGGVPRVAPRSAAAQSRCRSVGDLGEGVDLTAGVGRREVLAALERNFVAAVRRDGPSVLRIGRFANTSNFTPPLRRHVPGSTAASKDSGSQRSMTKSFTESLRPPWPGTRRRRASRTW